MTKFQVSNISKGTRHLVEIPQDPSKVLKSAQADVHRRRVKSASNITIYRKYV